MTAFSRYHAHRDLERDGLLEGENRMNLRLLRLVLARLEILLFIGLLFHLLAPHIIGGPGAVPLWWLFSAGWLAAACAWLQKPER